MTDAIAYAKPAFDIGFATDDLEAHRTIWEGAAALPYDHLAKLGGGFHQHRWRLGQSIVKVNHSRAPLPATPPGGFRRLTVAADRDADMATPEGTSVRLRPMNDIDLELAVVANDPDAFDRFYGALLGFAPDGPHAFRLGRCRIVATRGAAPRIDDWRAAGLRYMTVQIFDCDGVMSRLADASAEIGRPPRTLGQVRYGFVRDGDGNWIEISERASLTGKAMPGDCC